MTFLALSFVLLVPGPWDPPREIRELAALQDVPLVDAPLVEPAGRCAEPDDPWRCSCVHPECHEAYDGTRRLSAWLLQRFPGVGPCGLYCCRQSAAARFDEDGQARPLRLSVHALGRAIDLCVEPIGGDADNETGDPLANWLVAHAEFVGVQRVIWDHVWWNPVRGFGELGANELDHTNHVHVELSYDGALGRTPFFTSGAVDGRCESHCAGSLRVAEDCAVTECAAQGARCQPGPPARCGDPPPPEPDEAALNPGAPMPNVRPLGGPARVTPIHPRRVVDTRLPQRSTALRRGDGAAEGPLTARHVNVATVRPAELGLPADTTALWVNAAVLARGEWGFLTLHPSDRPTPDASNLNHGAVGVRANGASVVLGAGGGIGVYSYAAPDLLLDVTAGFGPTGDGLTLQGPVRVHDSRSGAPVAAGADLEVPLRLPDAATGVVDTVTVVPQEDAGFLTTWACGAEAGEVSSHNYAAGTPVANTVVSRIGGGRMCVRPSSAVHVLVDVVGYLSPAGSLSFRAVEPVRLLDTRQANSRYVGRVGPRQILELPLRGLPGVNLTTLVASERGFLTLFPCADAQPNVSAANYTAEGGAVATVATSAVRADGRLCVASFGRTHLIVDLQGVWTASAPEEIPDSPPEPGQGEEAEPGVPAPDAAAQAAPGDGAPSGPPGRDAAVPSPPAPDADTPRDSAPTPDPARSDGGAAEARADGAAPPAPVGSAGAEAALTGGCSASPGGVPAITPLLLLFVVLARRRQEP